MAEDLDIVKGSKEEKGVLLNTVAKAYNDGVAVNLHLGFGKFQLHQLSAAVSKPLCTCQY